MTAIRCAAVQFCHRASIKSYNLAVIRSFVDQAVLEGVQIVAFPEMCITGYWHIRNLGKADLEALAELVPGGASTKELQELARANGIGIGAGLLEQATEGRLFNSYVVCLPDGAVHCHRKIHSFESEHISSGHRYTVFDTPWGVRIGILICWDNNLVENPRAVALLGADVLIAPHQTGGCASRSPHAMGLIDPVLWQARAKDPTAIEAEFRGPKGREWLMRWLPARAHDNGIFIVFSNGVGEEMARSEQAMP